jgi:MerR family transcriptional regulator/heat shock protein HspR
MPREINEPKYVISIAARILGCEVHNLRYYERLGLIQPFRSQGNIRYYSEADITRLRHVKALMDDMGVNMAGVEIIMRMGQKIVELQHRVDALEAELKRQGQPETAKRK